MDDARGDEQHREGRGGGAGDQHADEVPEGGGQRIASEAMSTRERIAASDSAGDPRCGQDQPELQIEPGEDLGPDRTQGRLHRFHDPL